MSIRELSIKISIKNALLPTEHSQNMVVNLLWVVLEEKDNRKLIVKGN